MKSERKRKFRDPWRSSTPSTVRSRPHCFRGLQLPFLFLVRARNKHASTYLVKLNCLMAFSVVQINRKNTARFRCVGKASIHQTLELEKPRKVDFKIKKKYFVHGRKLIFCVSKMFDFKIFPSAQECCLSCFGNLLQDAHSNRQQGILVPDYFQR